MQKLMHSQYIYLPVTIHIFNLYKDLKKLLAIYISSKLA